MRVSKEQAARNRERVIDVASRSFRRNGFDGIGVDGLMAEAGLTHGGFYKQFASKEDLATEACRHAFKALAQEWAEAVDQSSSPFATLVEKYLSARHRADSDHGCPLAALASEAARRGDPMKQVFEVGIEGFVTQLVRALPELSEQDARARALEALSMMVGGVVLARAVGERTPLADEIVGIAKRSALRTREG